MLISKAKRTNFKQMPIYDLEDRTLSFAKDVRTFIKEIPKSLCNNEDSRQLIRSSGSVGANYIEANEALGKRDFKMRIRIAGKEAKESRYWLRLLDIKDSNLVKERERLIDESSQLLKILSSILIKSA